MEQKLFSDTEVFQKERPTKPTAQQLADFYSEMAKEIIAEGFSQSDEEDIIQDLKDLYPFHDNGFELAKKLDEWKANASYNIDGRFCEWLEGFSSEYDKIKRDNVKAWVKAHNPQPKFNKGTKLIINDSISYSLKKGGIVYITGGRPEEAIYWLNESPNNYGGYNVAYEVVESKCSPID